MPLSLLRTIFQRVIEALDSFSRFVFWGAVSLRGGSGIGAVFPTLTSLRSAVAITVPAHVARFAAAEAGPFWP